MAANSFTPKQALDVLLRKLGERDDQLAMQVRLAIDVGKDVQERQARGGKRKPRIYRKTVRFTDDEALQIAIEVLQAYFVEIPLFVNSAIENSSASPIGEPVDRPGRTTRQAQGTAPKLAGALKSIQIEVQTETQILQEGPQTFPLEPISSEEIEQQKANLDRLAHVLDIRNG